MNIAIDGRPLAGASSGFKTYALNLIKGLAAIDFEDLFFVYLNDQRTPLPWGRQENFRAVPLHSYFGGAVWKQIGLPLDAALHRRKIDVFHFLCNSPSYTSPGALVYTVHDLSFKYFPAMISRSHYYSLSLQIPLGIKRAEKIITDSESTKQDLCHLLNVDPVKVAVIPLGIDPAFSPITDGALLDAIRMKYGLPDRFILYVGSYLQHKNLATILSALQRLPVRLKEEYKLVLVGRQGRNFQNIQKKVFSLSLQDQVIFLDRVPFEDLPAFYSLATLFVYPSLYEGFGLPVLEAMGCGLPVIASNRSSIPEVVSDAGILVRPQDVDEWSDAIERVLTRSELHSQMSASGLERARLFHWDKTAQQTLAVYRELA
jgi:glycosyltransferase involved in cell wall biosynthesis